jgi:hypothetical protein
VLSDDCRFEDLDPLHWERLLRLASNGSVGSPLEAAWAMAAQAPSPVPKDWTRLGLPWERLARFSAKMLPPECIFVLGVFDGDALWIALFAHIRAGQVRLLSGAAALDPEDLKDVVGRDQHPFLLAMVANRYRLPSFGWFCQREDFEAYLAASTVDAKDQIFQTLLLKRRATFDFNILIDRGITPLGPVNPGSAAIAGVDREANPRTRTPNPEDPGPSAY